jgi:hypothetical protein
VKKGMEKWLSDHEARKECTKNDSLNSKDRNNTNSDRTMILKCLLRKLCMRAWGLFYDVWQGTVFSCCTKCNKPSAANKARNLQRIRHP